MTPTLRKGLPFFILFFLLGSVYSVVNGQEILYQHKFETAIITNSSIYSENPDTIDPHLNNSFFESNNNNFYSSAGKTGNALSLKSSNINSGNIIQLKFDVENGYNCSITGLSFWRRRSDTGHDTMELKIHNISILKTTTSNSSSGTVENISTSQFNNLEGTVIISIILTGASGTSGTFRLDDFTIYGVVTKAAFVSVKDGDWFANSTWNTNTVPTSDDNVVINHAVFSDNYIKRNSGTTTTVSKDHSLAMRNHYENNGTTNILGTFQLDNGSWVDGDNYFTYGPESYLVFNGGGTYGIDPGLKFWPHTNGPQNVTLNETSNVSLNDGPRTVIGKLELDATFYNKDGITINGQLVIKNHGSIDINPPNYGSASSLIYQANKTYDIWKEWTNSATPHNVQLTSNTVLNYTNVQEARTITGNLTIDGGSALYMDYGDNIQSFPLTVLGNVDVSGILTLGDFFGDDLITSGDITFNPGYNFDPNNRAIKFIRNGTQSISTPSNTPLTIPYLVIGKDDGSTTTNVIINQNLTISAPNGDAAIKFKSANSSLNINGNELTIGTPGTGNFIEGLGGFIGSNASKLKLLGTGSIGSIKFISNLTLQSLIIDRTAAQTAATLGSDLTLTGSYNAFTNGILDINNYNFTFDANAGYTGGNSQNSFIQADGNGKVYKKYNSTGSFIFPIGDQAGIDFSPAEISLTSLSGIVRVGMNVRNEKHANVSAPNYLNRFWQVSADGSTYYSANTKFYYTLSDVSGSESTLIAGGFKSPNWYLGDNANTTEHSLSVSEDDDLNKDYTGDDAFSPIGTKPNGYYQTVKTGTWGDASVWESSSNNNNWYPSSTYPTSSAKSITIKNGHTVTLKNDESARMLTIEAGGTLTNEDIIGGHLLTIVDDGTSEPDFKIKGTYVLFGRQPELNGNASVTVFTGGVVRADNNYNPGKSDEFARNSKVTFLTGSIFNWNTTNAFATANQTYFPNAVSQIPVFKITKNINVGAGTSTIFNCLTSIDANVMFSGAGKKYFRDGICGSGVLIDSSTGNNTTLFVTGAPSAVLGGNSLQINLKNNLNLQSTSVTIPTDSIVTISGGNIGNSYSGNILTINGTLDMTTQSINNSSGTIDLYGIYRTAKSGGFSGSGSSISSGMVIVNSSSIVELYANTDQNLILRDFSTLLFSGSGKKTMNGTSKLPIENIIIRDDAIVDWGNNKMDTSNTTNLKMLGGRLIVSAADISPTMKGEYDLSGGTIEFANNSTGTTQTIRSATYKNIEVTGTNVGNSNGNITLAPNGTFTVKKDATFTINRYSITSPDESGTVTIEEDAVFKTGNNKGFHGYASEATNQSSIHQDITNIILEKGSTVEYSRDTYANNDQPITNANNLVYQNLVLSGSGNKIAPPDELKIKGDFSQFGSSVFVPNDGTVSFTGNDVQTISDATGAAVHFYNLNNQNQSGFNVNSKISIAKTFQPGNKSKTILNADIVMKSDANNTANIGIIPIGTDAASIIYGAGQFVVERFIPKHPKAWQLLSVPTKESLIKDSWQQSVNITDHRPDWEAKGFDYQSASPSMKTYDPVSNNYVGINSTGDFIDNVHGYFLFVRGDRTVSYGNDPTEVTLFTKGKIYAPTPSGSDPLPINVLPNSFALIGNPYASSIDFNQLDISGLDYAYYIWDSKLTTGSHSSYGVGGWRTISCNSVTPQGIDYYDGNIPAIQSGQAFFVKNSSSDQQQIQFTEQVKTSESKSIFKESKGISRPSAKIRINLLTKNGNENILLDGTLSLFGKEYSSGVDHLDAKKMWNAAENISLPNGNFSLAIERRHLPFETDTLFIDMTGMSKRDYLFQVKLDNLNEQFLQSYFHDRFSGEEKMLNDGSNDIEFTITADKATANKKRFFITFKKISQPVTIINLKAFPIDENIKVSWETIQENDVDSYVIETASEKTEFAAIGSIVQNKSAHYNWTHIDPTEGKHFYRIKAVLKNKEIIYSEIAEVIMKYPDMRLEVYPNPVTNNKLQLHMVRQAEGKYMVNISDASGRKLLSTFINHKGFNNTHKIQLPQFTAGIYFVEVKRPDGSVWKTNVLVE